MYKQRDDIVRLIDALTSGEKRHFTELFTPDSKEDAVPLYLQLYRVHENEKSQLTEDLKTIQPRSLTAAKRRLYDNIMDSLLLLHRDRSTNIILQNQLSKIELLYAKGLSDQALVIWNKAYRLAVEKEKFNLQLQLLDWEKRLNIVLDTPTRDQDAIKDEEDSILKKLQQILMLERLYSHIMLFKKQHGFAKGTIAIQLEAATIKAAEMPSAEDCLSRKALFYHDLIFSVYYWMTFEHLKGYVYSKKLLQQTGENIVSKDFLNGILQHITSAVCLGKFHDALNGIKLGNAFLEEYGLVHSNSFKSLMFAYQATYSLISYAYMGDRIRLRDTLLQTEAQLKDYTSFIPVDLRKIILGNMMTGYMAIGETDKADELWSLLMNNKQYRKVREDISGDLYLFRLFSLLHAKRYGLIPSAALSAYRYFSKPEDQEQVYPVELTIARLLRKDRDYEHIEILREVLDTASYTVKNFIDGLQGLKSFQEHYTRYIIWADAILHDEPYFIAAQRWYEKFSEEY